MFTVRILSPAYEKKGMSIFSYKFLTQPASLHYLCLWWWTNTGLTRVPLSWFAFLGDKIRTILHSSTSPWDERHFQINALLPQVWSKYGFSLQRRRFDHLFLHASLSRRYSLTPTLVLLAMFYPKDQCYFGQGGIWMKGSRMLAPQVIPPHGISLALDSISDAG